MLPVPRMPMVAVAVSIFLLPLPKTERSFPVSTRSTSWRVETDGTALALQEGILPDHVDGFTACIGDDGVARTDRHAGSGGFAIDGDVPGDFVNTGQDRLAACRQRVTDQSADAGAVEQSGGRQFFDDFTTGVSGHAKSFC